jgi:hypothetical protein
MRVQRRAAPITVLTGGPVLAAERCKDLTRQHFDVLPTLYWFARNNPVDMKPGAEGDRFAVPQTN